jgi:hypothetical protein
MRISVVVPLRTHARYTRARPGLPLPEKVSFSPAVVGRRLQVPGRLAAELAQRKVSAESIASGMVRFETKSAVPARPRHLRKRGTFLRSARRATTLHTPATKTMLCLSIVLIQGFCLSAGTRAVGAETPGRRRFWRLTRRTEFGHNSPVRHRILDALTTSWEMVNMDPCMCTRQRDGSWCLRLAVRSIASSCESFAHFFMRHLSSEARERKDTTPVHSR